ncbi:MAG TPA: hypothetical protein VNN79_09705 [Actinomycetota bacterium]|nr:hypothetical protein [Actinomycetota bacterium]
MMTRRMAIAMSGVVAGSLMAGMVGAQLASARFASPAPPAKVVRQVSVSPPAPAAPQPVAFDSERE